MIQDLSLDSAKIRKAISRYFISQNSILIRWECDDMETKLNLQMNHVSQKKRRCRHCFCHRPTNTVRSTYWKRKKDTTSHQWSYRSAMSWSCSGGTGTPFTDLSLWIWLKVCLCSSRFFSISCKTAAWMWRTRHATHRVTQRTRRPLPYAARVSCAARWPSPRERAGEEHPPWEPTLPGGARLPPLPGGREETCPGGCASPTATFDIQIFF